MIAPMERNSKIWSVIRVSSGNFLEMYDFMVFGYYAAAIGRAFFLCEGEGLRTSVKPHTITIHC